MRKLWVSPILFGLLGLGTGTSLAQDWLLPVQAPPFTRVQAEGASLQGDPRKGEYWVSVPTGKGETAKLRARGPFGGEVSATLSPAWAGQAYQFSSGVIANRDPNPSALPVLPTLCPRLQAVETPGIKTGDTPRFVYQAAQDRLNRLPLGQMGDPDAMEGQQAKSVAEMDGRNALLVKRISVRYDYEDANIVDYERFNPKTGERQAVFEGMSGFYANFHYAVIPYAPGIADLPRQTLLHLAQGRLKEIGREELRPALRTHSFLPGPFFSKEQWGYALCEWGDTEYQAPNQELEYAGLALWDWDYSIPGADHLLLIVWEEDEEGELRRQGLIPPNYLTDDLVGVFEIRREETLGPRRYRNLRGDFEITLETGDLAGAALSAKDSKDEPLMTRSVDNLGLARGR
ncbi:MAG: hypothetical protein U1F66_10265 [bacterium]